MGHFVRAVACLAAASACGRYGFHDDVASDGRGGDGRGGDGPASDAPASDAPASDAPAGASCGALPPTCGPSATSSCCGNAAVPGGVYFRSYDVGTDGAFPDMSNPATVSTFRLDIYEVTVGRFRQFVAAGMGTQAAPPATGAGAHAQIPNSGWDPSFDASLVANTPALVAALACNAAHTWTDAPGPNESLAINCITWFEAFAFCAWDGGFLPTEAEWNYAATGGAEQRAYPWSVPPSTIAIDCAHANYHPSGFCVGGVNRVGSESPAGDGKWGHADLSGNVLEWTLDWSGAYPNPCTDCADLTVSTTRVSRGGFWGNSTLTNLRAAHINNSAPTTRDAGTGVRCARQP